jgi:hypothetical protein
MVCYKEGTMGEFTAEVNAILNPGCGPVFGATVYAALGTTDGCRPENTLSGQITAI